MRIAHAVRAVFPQHGYGGLERAGAALTTHLLARGLDVDLYTRPLPPGQPFVTDSAWAGRLVVHGTPYGRLPLKPNGIPARLTNYRMFVERVGAQVEGMARHGYLDAVYAQGLCAYGVRAAANWGVPVVANPQGMEDFKVRDPLKRIAYAPFRAWVRAGCRAADRVIATDFANASEVSSLLGVDPATVEVIPNGVDVDACLSLVDRGEQNRLVARWPQLADNVGLRGISVGRLEENKGFEVLLRALAVAGAQMGDWQWVLVGDGSLRPHLEEVSISLGLHERVLFAGAVNDSELHNLYAMANLFVHPTLYEGSSLVTLEAMAHALPVVASAVGGIPDKVLPEETGFLVPRDDIDAVVERLVWMSGHREEAVGMGERGNLLARDRFSWREIARQTEELCWMLFEEKAVCTAAEVVAAR